MQKPLVYLYTIKQLKIFFDLVKFVRYFPGCIFKYECKARQFCKVC